MTLHYQLSSVQFLPKLLKQPRVPIQGRLKCISSIEWYYARSFAKKEVRHFAPAALTMVIINKISG